MDQVLDGGPSGLVLPPLRRPEFRRLLAISITVSIGFGMIVPILPLFARSFGVGLAAIGTVQLVFGTTRFAFGLVGGLVVDRFGERACTITGLLVVSASSFAAGTADDFGYLVLARGFGGAGSALFIAGLTNRILRIIEPQAMGRATGAFRSSFLIGIGAGPVFGGFVARHLGLAAPFFFYGSALIVAAVVAWVVMAGETGTMDGERRTPWEALRAARPLFSDSRYITALAVTAVGWWTLSGPTGTIGPVFAADRLSFSEDQIGLAVTMLAVGEVAALLVSGRAADRWGRNAVLIPSLLLTGGAIAGFALIGESTAWTYFLLMVLAGAGIAASSTASGALLADAVGGKRSGAAVGVNQMAGDLGYLTSPLAIGALAEATSFRLAFVAGAAPAFLALALVLRGLGRRPREIVAS